jgi:hypothetical protein
MRTKLICNWLTVNPILELNSCFSIHFKIIHSIIFFAVILSQVLNYFQEINSLTQKTIYTNIRQDL